MDLSSIGVMIYVCWMNKNGLGRKEVVMELFKGVKVKRLMLGCSEYWVGMDREMGVEMVIVEGVGYWFYYVKV